MFLFTFMNTCFEEFFFQFSQPVPVATYVFHERVVVLSVSVRSRCIICVRMIWLHYLCPYALIALSVSVRSDCIICVRTIWLHYLYPYDRVALSVSIRSGCIICIHTIGLHYMCPFCKTQSCRLHLERIISLKTTAETD